MRSWQLTRTILVSLLAVMGLMSAAQAQEATLPPSIIPVVVLSGSFSEMGYQYGQQAAKEIERVVLQMWAGRIRTFGNREAVINELKPSQLFIRKYAPEVIEFMEGMARGATAAGCDVSYTDVLLCNTRPSTPTSTSTYPPEAETENIECSNFSAWGTTTTDGRLICSDSSDSSYKPMVMIVAFPDEGNNYIAVCPTGQVGSHPCMNNKGLWIGNSNGCGSRDIDKDYGFPEDPFTMHLLLYANSAAEAVEMLSPWEAQYGLNIAFSDSSGDGYVVEMSAALKAVRASGDFGEEDFIYAANNCLTQEMGEAQEYTEFIEHGGWASTSSVPRNLQMWKMLSEYRGEVDVEFAKMMWRFPGNPPPEPPEEGHWNKYILNRRTRRVGIALPDNGDEGVLYLCTGHPGRVVLQASGRGSYPIAPTNSFYRVMLTDGPDALVSAAQRDAENYFVEMNNALMQLDYTDAAYSTLEDIYALALTEFYAGQEFYDRARLASGGDEALFYYGKAATEFTKAQAHALQVVNAINPPATTPEELGLNPWEW